MAKKKVDFKKGFVHTVTIFFLILTFASWGVADYVRSDSAEDQLVKVGKVDISVSLFDQQLQRFRAYARQERPNVTEEELNSPRMVEEQLAQTIRDQLINQYINKYHLYPSINRVAKTIATQAEFSENGVFSPERYLQVLKQMRQTPAVFEDGVKHSLARDTFFPRLALAEITTPESASVFLRLGSETRTVYPHRLTSAEFADTVKPADDDLRTYFSAHQAEFDTPARAKADYVDFSPITLINLVPNPTDEALQAFWDGLKATGAWNTQEKRTARHLLIRFGTDKVAAKKRIEELLAKVKNTPSDFANMAKKYSEDPGSKDQGGLITDIVAGQMVAAFDQALFALAPGAISDVVETPYGYHIIQLEKVVSPDKLTLADVKKELLPKYREDEAKKLFDAFSEEFLNLADSNKEAQDGMKKLAEPYQLPVGSSNWIEDGKPKLTEAIYPFDHDAVRAAVLLPANMTSGAINVVKIPRENKLIALRVTEHTPRTPRNFEEAKADVLAVVKAQQIREKLTRKADELLSDLKAGKMKVDDVLWEKPINMNRIQARISPQLLEETFSQPSSPLPHYFIAQDDDKQITLYRLASVANDEKLETAMGAQLNQVFAQYWGDKQERMVLAALAEEFPVNINKAALNKLLNPPKL